MLCVRRQIEVRAIGDPFELAPIGSAEAETVLDVDRPLGIMGELLLRVLVQPKILGVDSQADVPVAPLVDPILVPFFVGSGLDEEFHFHLLELARAENKISRCDLVAEGLSNLPDSKRGALAGRRHDVLEIDENALRRLGSKVVEARFVLDRPQVGLEHHVEVAGLRPLAARSAIAAGDLGELDRIGVFDPFLSREFLLDLVDAKALVARKALGERIVEDADVARSDPHLARKDDRRVEADDVVARRDHVPPPLPFDVLLQLDAQRAVVPRGSRAAVYLAAREDEAAPLRQGDDAVEFRGGLLGHRAALLSLPRLDDAESSRFYRRSPARRRPRMGFSTQPAIP